MVILFNFNPSEVIVNVKLAFSYTPRILKNHITRRTNTGLLYISSGEYRYSYENTSFLAGANSLIYLPANSTAYDYQVSKSYAEPVRTMQIELELLDASSRKPIVYSTHPTLLTKCADGSVPLCIGTIISTNMKTDSVSRLTVHSEIFRLLALCAQCTEDAQFAAKHSKIAPAIEYIQNNYKRAFPISELAALCHIGESQLRRIFLDKMGMSPTGYKNELILREACELLNNGELSIGEISYILGFCDVYAFTHFFKKKKGVSPTVYKTQTKT